MAWKLTDERKEQKAKTFDDNNEAKEEYKRWDREVKKKCRSDRQAWVDEKAAEAEQAGARNDTRTLYRILKQFAGVGVGSNSVSVKNKDGKS